MHLLCDELFAIGKLVRSWEGFVTENFNLTVFCLSMVEECLEEIESSKTEELLDARETLLISYWKPEVWITNLLQICFHGILSTGRREFKEFNSNLKGISKNSFEIVKLWCVFEVNSKMCFPRSLKVH